MFFGRLFWVSLVVCVPAMLRFYGALKNKRNEQGKDGAARYPGRFPLIFARFGGPTLNFSKLTGTVRTSSGRKLFGCVFDEFSGGCLVRGGWGRHCGFCVGVLCAINPRGGGLRVRFFVGFLSRRVFVTTFVEGLRLGPLSWAHVLGDHGLGSRKWTTDAFENGCIGNVIS